MRCARTGQNRTGSLMPRQRQTAPSLAAAAACEWAKVAGNGIEFAVDFVGPFVRAYAGLLSLCTPRCGQAAEIGAKWVGLNCTPGRGESRLLAQCGWEGTDIWTTLFQTQSLACHRWGLRGKRPFSAGIGGSHCRLQRAALCSNACAANRRLVIVVVRGLGTAASAHTKGWL